MLLFEKSSCLYIIPISSRNRCGVSQTANWLYLHGTSLYLQLECTGTDPCCIVSNDGRHNIHWITSLSFLSINSQHLSSINLSKALVGLTLSHICNSGVNCDRMWFVHTQIHSSRWCSPHEILLRIYRIRETGTVLLEKNRCMYDYRTRIIRLILIGNSLDVLQSQIQISLNISPWSLSNHLINVSPSIDFYKSMDGDTLIIFVFSSTSSPFRSLPNSLATMDSFLFSREIHYVWQMRNKWVIIIIKMKKRIRHSQLIFLEGFWCCRSMDQRGFRTDAVQCKVSEEKRWIVF